MVKKSLFSVCLLFTSLCLATIANAQQIVVVDEQDNSPIAQATIQLEDTDKAAVTNVMGRADISSLGTEGRLIIRHVGYKPVLITFERLAKQAYIVSMRAAAEELEDVVISANKWEQDKREIPQSITQFKALEIAKAEPATTADLLSVGGQVFIQKSQLGGGSPMIRGFAANSVLLVVDGVRMNNAIYRSGNLQNVITLDPNSLSEAEVVYGPGAVIYGSDALGGVMDFHTKSPEFSSEGISTTGGVLLRGASAAKAITGSFNLSVSLPKFASFTSFTYNDFDDLRSGKNRPKDFPNFGKRYWYVERIEGQDQRIENDDVNIQTPSGYNQTNVLQKFKWKTSNFSDLTYAFHYATSSDIPRYDRLIQTNIVSQPVYAEWHYGPQEWQMHSLQSRFFYPTKLFDALKITTAYQLVEESRHDRRFSEDWLRHRTEKVDALSLNLDFERSFGLNNELFYGIELVGNKVNSEAYAEDIVDGSTRPESTRYPDGDNTWNSAAAYFSLKNELSQRWILNTGLRYNFVKLNAEFVDKSFYDFPYDEINLKNGSLNGNLGIVFLPSAKLKLNALLSTGFRAPNMDDVGKVFDSEQGVVIVPNPDLKPEKTYNFEYGFDAQLTPALKINVVNYFTMLKDAMVRRPFTFNGQSQIEYDGVMSDVYAEVNTGEAFIWGLSAQLNYRLANGLNAYMNLTYTDGKDTVEDLPLRHVSPVFGETGISYKKDQLETNFIVRYSGGIAFEDLAPSEQNKPYLYTSDGALPWYILNLSSSYNFSEYFSVHLNLENLLDTHYRTYSSGISAAGFNAILALRATF